MIVALGRIVGRSVSASHGRKIRASITINADLHKWVMERTGDGKEFATLSHAIERGIVALKERSETKR